MESEIDFSDIERKYKIETPTTFENVVLIDNAPVVEEVKADRLLSVMRKTFSNIGTIEEFVMPREADGKSKGFLFAIFSSAQEAKQAVELGNGVKFGKSHILSVLPFDEIEHYFNVSDEFEAPTIPDFIEKANYTHWLADAGARDQYAIVKGNEVGIFYHNKGDVSESVEVRNNWSDSSVMWSPNGSYLATVHKQGVSIWAGKEWQKINRFTHANVEHLQFSPSERYLATFSSVPIEIDGASHNICVWEILSGKLLRTFAEPKNKPNSPPQTWPYLKWSFDDSHVARITPGERGSLFVYEAETMQLLNKKSVKIENLIGFDWSPSANIISYWSSENGNIPARITLMNIPSKTVLRTKNFFGVLNMQLFWHPAGEYLLVRVDRAKTKHKNISSFEIFRMQEKDIPVDVTELQAGIDINGIFWEPSGSRFAVSASEENLNYVHFYEVMPSNSAQAIKLASKLNSKGPTQAYWSPAGRFCVLTGKKGYGGEIQFYDTNDEVNLLATGEHFDCTHWEWDPTGRYFATSVSSWVAANDTGLVIWSVVGEELDRQNIVNFKQFSWRPRPKSLISPEQQETIRSNLKKYAKEFEEEDARNSKKAFNEVEARRKLQWAEYKAMITSFMEKRNQNSSKLFELFGYNPYEENPADLIETIVAEVVEETQEIVEK